MGFIDLHVHSSASDGTMSPSEVVAYALSKGLDAIALTDHDTVGGLAEAEAAAGGTTLELIPGIEMSCVVETPSPSPSAEQKPKGTEIHILGLYIDKDSPALVQGLTSIRRIRDERNERILHQFQEDGFDITREDLISGKPDAIITRAHFARVLTEKGYTATRKQAFEKYLKYGGRYCTRQEITTPEQVMEILLKAGAFPVIAHPLQYHMGYEQVEALITYLKGLGLKGIEVYHSSHNQHESRKLKEMALRLHLLPTGGSDFHGDNKPDIDLGFGRGGLRLSHLLLNDIKEAHIHGRTVSDD